MLCQACRSLLDVLCVNAVSYGISAACFLFIRFPRAESVLMGEASLAGTFRDVLEGFHYVLRQQRIILMLIGAASMYTFATSAFSTSVSSGLVIVKSPDRKRFQNDGSTSMPVTTNAPTNAAPVLSTNVAEAPRRVA